jgi:hypothetical protein
MLRIAIAATKLFNRLYIQTLAKLFKRLIDDLALALAQLARYGLNHPSLP